MFVSQVKNFVVSSTLRPQSFTEKYSKAATAHKIRQDYKIFKKGRFITGVLSAYVEVDLPDWSSVIPCESKFSSLKILCACGTFKKLVTSFGDHRRI